MDLGLSRTRSGALLAGAGCLLLLAGGLLDRSAQHRADDFTTVLEAGAGWALVLASAWLCVVTFLLVLEAWSGRRRSTPAWCAPPALLRRLVVVSGGIALTAGLAPAANAAPAPAPPPASASIPLDGLRLPAPPVGEAGHPTAGTHTVRSGDTLWGLARGVAPGASDADVASIVQRLHTDNRSVIGADPDVLRPGQRLVIAEDLR